MEETANVPKDHGSLDRRRSLHGELAVSLEVDHSGVIETRITITGIESRGDPTPTVLIANPRACLFSFLSPSSPTSCQFNGRSAERERGNIHWLSTL